MESDKGSLNNLRAFVSSCSDEDLNSAHDVIDAELDSRREQFEKDTATRAAALGKKKRVRGPNKTKPEIVLPEEKPDPSALGFE